MIKARVLLADGHEEMLTLLSRLMFPKLTIVGSARNGRDAINMALRLQPDLFVLDIAMPLMDGLDIAARLRDAKVATKIVFLSTFDDRQLAEAALSCGGRGFVIKSQMYTDLPQAIEAVLAGGTFVSSSEKR